MFYENIFLFQYWRWSRSVQRRQGHIHRTGSISLNDRMRGFSEPSVDQLKSLAVWWSPQMFAFVRGPRCFDQHCVPLDSVEKGICEPHRSTHCWVPSYFWGCMKCQRIFSAPNSETCCFSYRIASEEHELCKKIFDASTLDCCLQSEVSVEPSIVMKSSSIEGNSRLQKIDRKMNPIRAALILSTTILQTAEFTLKVEDLLQTMRNSVSSSNISMSIEWYA